MYKRLYGYLTINNILFNKQFEFQAGHLTEPIGQICDSVNNKIYLIRIFINLSKAFDTVGHSILLKKIEHYGIKGKNLSWFQSYLSDNSQYIGYNQENKTGNTGL